MSKVKVRDFDFEKWMFWDPSLPSFASIYIYFTCVENNLVGGVAILFYFTLFFEQSQHTMLHQFQVHNIDVQHLYAMLTTTVPTICYHATLLQYHSLYSLFCAFYPHDLLIQLPDACFSHSLHPFCPLPLEPLICSLEN